MILPPLEKVFRKLMGKQIIKRIKSKKAILLSYHSSDLNAPILPGVKLAVLKGFSIEPSPDL
jgi:hypothetical protein